MKLTTVVIFFVFVAGQIAAQINPQRLEYERKIGKISKNEKWRNCPNRCWWGFVVAGVATIVNSIESYSTTTNNNGSSTTQTSTTMGDNFGIGIAAYLVGATGLGAGIPLWIVGGHQKRKYERKLSQIELGFNLNPQRSGLTLKYRF